MGMGGAFDAIMEEKLLNLHTAFIAKIVSVQSASLCTVRPLDKIKAYGQAAKSQAVISRVPILSHARIELYFLGNIVKASVNSHTNVAALLCRGKYLFVHALLSSYHGRQHHKAFALRKLHYLINYRICSLLSYLLAAHGTVRDTCSSIEQTKIVVYLGDRSHGRAWVFRGSLLVYGNSRRQSLDKVHLGLIKLSEKLTCVR